jgi:hypothetical protein
MRVVRAGTSDFLVAEIRPKQHDQVNILENFLKNPHI